MCFYCLFSAAPNNENSVVAPVIMSCIKEEPIDDAVASTSAEQHQLIKKEEPIDDAVASTLAEQHQLIKREEPADDAVASTSAEQHQLIKREEPIEDSVASTSAEQHQLFKNEDFIDIKDEPLINTGDDCSIKLVSYCVFVTPISVFQDPLKA
jgi:hypothetical protein